MLNDVAPDLPVNPGSRRFDRDTLARWFMMDLKDCNHLFQKMSMLSVVEATGYLVA